MAEDSKKKLTPEEMQELRDSIVEGVEQFFESYDWDNAFLKYQEKNQNPK